MKLRCEAKVAECMTKWLQEKTSGKGRENELHMPNQEEEHTENRKTGEVGGAEERTPVETGESAGGGWE